MFGNHTREKNPPSFLPLVVLSIAQVWNERRSGRWRKVADSWFSLRSGITSVDISIDSRSNKTATIFCLSSLHFPPFCSIFFPPRLFLSSILAFLVSPIASAFLPCPLAISRVDEVITSSSIRSHRSWRVQRLCICVCPCASIRYANVSCSTTVRRQNPTDRLATTVYMATREIGNLTGKETRLYSKTFFPYRRNICLNIGIVFLQHLLTLLVSVHFYSLFDSFVPKMMYESV